MIGLREMMLVGCSLRWQGWKEEEVGDGRGQGGVRSLG